MCFLPDKWLQHFSATGRRVRSVWISGKPKNVTSQTPAGLSFELWSLTEEKVGFSGTLSDGPAKKGRDWEKPGGYYGRKALCMCLCVSVCMRGREKRNKGRGWGLKWHRICSFSNSFLLPHRHQVISFLATVGYKAFLNVIQRGCEGLRLVCGLQGLLQEVLYQRREEIDSRTSGEQWRWHGITNRYEKAPTWGQGQGSWCGRLHLSRPVSLLLSSPTIPPHPSFPFSAAILWNAKQSGQSPHLGFPLETAN